MLLPVKQHVVLCTTLYYVDILKGDRSIRVVPPNDRYPTLKGRPHRLLPLLNRKINLVPLLVPVSPDVFPPSFRSGREQLPLLYHPLVLSVLLVVLPLPLSLGLPVELLAL